MGYAFGGEVDDIESNLFCSLNLKTRKWQIITKHNPKNVIKNMEIPGSRSDHLMWKDEKRGSKGSVFIGYGNHYRKGKEYSEIHRLDIWRYDVAENKWYEIAVNGNCPLHRGEVGYTQTVNDGVVIFGGYSSMLNGWVKSEDGLKYNGYTYFGECYEYLSKHQKWVMIQSEVCPLHRAYTAMCIGTKRNLLFLYGGYHGGSVADNIVYDDLWMLDMNKLRSKDIECKDFKICQSRKCDKTQSHTKLFKCKGREMKTNSDCATFYCSKYCQKYDWTRSHRLLCKRQI